MAEAYLDYRAIKQKVLQNMHGRNPDSFWYLSVENSREMKTVYTRMDNMTAFIEWLDYMIGMQDNGLSSGGVLCSIAGGS